MIDSLKDLDKLFKLCRKNGVIELEHNGTKIKLGDLPESKDHRPDISESIDPFKNFPQGELSPEQLMFYSSGGSPDNDPELKTG